MISGRGLGHTGGTLDKLESIPGFRVDQTMERARDLLAAHGLFLIGQTEELAPADRKLYALRDVTGTVESIPLIASSIMSKKIAEGMDALVLDVKVGAGAFMPDRGRARELAATMVRIGEGAGKAVRALLTDMDVPLGYAVGNALEVAEALDVMRGEGPRDTTDLTVELGAEMVVLGGGTEGLDEARGRVRAILSDGRALARFQAIVEAQGGDPRVCDDPGLLPAAAHQETVPAIRDGYLVGVDPRAIARAALEVGAGRRLVSDEIDPATGVVLLARTGDQVEEGEPLAALCHDGEGAEVGAAILAGAFEIGDEPPARPPLVIERF
jgi:pyrimidine-nucleoside phosphorylase